MPFDVIGPQEAPHAGARSFSAPAVQAYNSGPDAGATASSASVIARVVAYGIVVAGGLLIGAFVGLIASLASGLIRIGC